MRGIRRRRARRTNTDTRSVALCNHPTLKTWIEAEIGDLVRWRLYAATVADALKRLTRGESSKSETLLLDIDLMNAAATLELAGGLDQRWWSGAVVAVGNARGMHRRYLSIDHSIERPLGSEALRAYIENGDRNDTQPIVSWPR